MSTVAVLIGLLAIGAVAWLWPGDSQAGTVDFFGKGVTQHPASVTSVSETCPVIAPDDTGQLPQTPTPDHCNEVTAVVKAGPEKGQSVVVQAPPEATRAGLVDGDAIRLMRIPGADGQPASYSYIGVDRQRHLMLMGALFLVVVVAVARLRGLMSVVGLGFAAVVIWRFMLPALLAGSPGWLIGLATSALIMFVVIYLTHGVSLRTSVAYLGTMLGIAVTAAVGWWGIAGARVSGLGGEASDALFARTANVNFRDIVLCAVIIAGLGVLNDVTITQASAVWELRAAGPQLTRRALFSSGMRIGRDHIASTIYTIAFAYAGTALALLALVSLFDRPLLDLLLDEGITEEVVRTLASAIGLVLAVPLTTALAVLTVGQSAGSAAYTD